MGLCICSHTSPQRSHLPYFAAPHRQLGPSHCKRYHRSLLLTFDALSGSRPFLIDYNCAWDFASAPTVASAVLRLHIQQAWTAKLKTAYHAVSLIRSTLDALSGSRPMPSAKNKNITALGDVFIFGGEHGTRTHGALTPYSLSRRAP